MNQLTKNFLLRLSIRCLHPLNNTRMLCAYQFSEYRKMEHSTTRSFINFGAKHSKVSANYRDNWRIRGGFQKIDFLKPQEKDIPQFINKDLIKNYMPQTQDKQQILSFQREYQVKMPNASGENNKILFDFSDMELPERVRNVLQSKGYEKPTPIQSVAIPVALQGGDLVSLAQTGSGKTMAFIVPAILHILSQSPTDFPRVVVLAPTRELAMQIYTQFQEFSDIISSTVVYGGQPKNIQKSHLVKSNQVIIATPGRLIDFISEGLSMDTVTQVILDEADRMLDMGFEPQIREILKYIRNDRQTLFFSATWAPEVEQLARDICKQCPQLLQIGSNGMQLNKDINQSIQIVTHRSKKTDLKQILKEVRENQTKILIFCEKKSDTYQLEQLVKEEGLHAACLNGDLSQQQRDLTMRLYRTGKVQVLIATNLASRGLDIDDIELVINYDFPRTIDDYIHRIGRTGRAGRSGKAISLIESSFPQKKVLKDLIHVLKQSGQFVSHQLREVATN